MTTQRGGIEPHMGGSAVFRLAGEGLLANKMRAALTMLGIVIGVAAVILMVAVGHGAQSKIQAQIKSLGTNLIVVTAGTATQGGANQGAATFNRLTADDAERIKAQATTLSGVSPVVMTRTQAVAGQANWRTSVDGVSTDYLAIREWSVSSGDAFTDADVTASRKVALLGSTVAKELFGEQDPVGTEIRLGTVPFTVVGVLATKGQTASGTDQDDMILVPYTTAQRRLSGFSFLGQILASASSPGNLAAAQSEIRQIMRDSHNLGQNAADDFTVRNQDDLVDTATATTSVMTWLLAAMASISLLVGGIGIMNIMLVSVTERTREIGIRRAIGARRGDVLAQFLTESVVLSTAGGLVGLGLGFLSAAVLRHVTGWATSTPTAAVFIAVGFSAAIGVFFGFYPARKAARLNPIEALRYE